MIRRMMLGAGLLVMVTACGDYDTAEERYFEHYQESVEQARDVSDRLERAQDRRRQMMDEHDPEPPRP